MKFLIVLLAVSAVYSKKQYGCGGCGDSYCPPCGDGYGGYGPAPNVAIRTAGVAIGGSVAVAPAVRTAPVTVARAAPVAVARPVVAAAPVAVARRVAVVAKPAVVKVVSVAGPQRVLANACDKAKVIIPSRWGPFGPYSSCTTRCGRGTQTRTRRCIQGDACSAPCIGPRQQTRRCGIPIIPAKWLPWGPYSGCSVACGKGHMTRHRKCVRGNVCSPDCRGPSTSTKPCSRPIIHAKWTRFGPYGPCSKKCGQGIQVRVRRCIPGNACGNTCSGHPTETRPCGKPIVPARWSPFGKYSKCSVSCGVGTQVSTRTCYRGNECGGICVGPNTKVRKCGTAIGQLSASGLLGCKAVPRPVAVAARTVVAARPVAAARTVVAAAPVVAPRVAAVAAAPVVTSRVAACNDLISECALWSTLGYCGRYQSTVATDCCSSCRAVGSYRTAAASSCFDANVRACGAYAKYGLCARPAYRGYMKDNCCSSCTGRLGRYKAGGGKLRYSPEQYVEMLEVELKRRRKK